MKKTNLWRLLSMLLLSMIATASSQSVYDWSAGPMEKSKLATQNYRGWIPESAAPLLGTLILIPGRHGDGRPMAADPYWQEIAKCIHFALMACQFSDGTPFEYQNDPDGEVSIALNAAIEKFSQESAHPELSKAPLAFWGHSAGGCVSCNYGNRFPKRVIACVAARSPRGPDGTISPDKEKIPMLILVGGKDKEDWVKDSLINTRRGREAKAPWTLAFHPSEGHDLGNSAPLTAAYLKSVIPMRLGAMEESSENSGSSSAKLQKLEIKGGWLGDPETKSALPFDSFEGKKSEAIWLPNETVAEAWALYLKAP